MGSMILGVLGVLGTGTAVLYGSRRAPHWRPQHHWLLVVAALFPAWLVAFLGLLPPITGEIPQDPLPPSGILSSGATLLGVIASDYALRRLQKSARVCHPLVYWLLGLAALIPGWFIALVDLR